MMFFLQSLQQIIVACLCYQKICYSPNFNIWVHVQAHSFADTPDTHVTLPGQPPSLITSYEQLKRDFLNIKRGYADRDFLSLVLSSGIIFNNVFI